MLHFGPGRQEACHHDSCAVPRSSNTLRDQDIALALEIPVGEEKAGVMRSLVDDIKAIAAVLATLPPKSAESAEQE
jgi:hypothetical protein